MTTLDEALERLRDTGPERAGWLSNHAPMAAEAMVRHGHADAVHRWIDTYSLEERPRGISPIEPDQWRDPLGDPVRTGDWIVYFEHAVRALLSAPLSAPFSAPFSAPSEPRVMELAHGLAYWAARWQPLAPAGAGPYRASDPRAALDAVPRVPDQRF